MRKKHKKNYGWMGKILRVDLTSGSVQEESTFDYTKDFLGGKGINVKLLWDTVPPHVDPFSTENHIIFGTGPLTGTLAPGSCRTVVTARSPLTSLLGRSNFGGQWGPELKFAGYDHLDVYGAASEPVYLVITNEGVNIRAAAHLWGKDVFYTKKAIKDELKDSDVKILAIGKAGENRVRYASIISGESNYSAAGRTGMGAILGAKNIKAIGVKGKRGVAVAKPTEFMKCCERINAALRNNPTYEVFGNPVDFLVLLSSAGFQSQGNLEGVGTPYDLSDLKKFIEQHKMKRVGCYGCPFHCQILMQTAGSKGAGIQCQAFIEFAQRTKNYTGKFIWESYLLAQKHGLDINSAAAAIAFAIDLFINEIISEKDTDGLVLNWGKPEVALQLLTMIVQREGIGDILAEGVQKAAQIIGRGAGSFAHTVRGLELAGQELRAHPGMALAFSVDERGDIAGCSPLEEVFAGLPSPDGKEYQHPSKTIDDEFRVQTQIYSENLGDATDILGVCKFLTPWNGMGMDERILAELFSLCTGIDLDGEGLFAYASEIRDLARKLELRWGRDYTNDVLPKKVFTDPIADGKFKGAIVDREKLSGLVKNYYARRGWDFHADGLFQTDDRTRESGKET